MLSREIVTAVATPTPVGAGHVVAVALDLIAVAPLVIVVVNELVLRSVVIRVGMEGGDFRHVVPICSRGAYDHRTMNPQRLVEPPKARADGVKRIGRVRDG